MVFIYSRNIIRAIVIPYYAIERMEISVISTNYVQIFSSKLCFGRELKQFRFNSSAAIVGIVNYDIIKKICKQPEKLLIDVREPDELKATGQIPTSINIPLSSVSQELMLTGKEFRTKYGRKKPKPETELIFHCHVGKRSQKAAEMAAALGYKNVKNYEGSWLDWADREGLSK